MLDLLGSPEVIIDEIVIEIYRNETLLRLSCKSSTELKELALEEEITDCYNCRTAISDCHMSISCCLYDNKERSSDMVCTILLKEGLPHWVRLSLPMTQTTILTCNSKQKIKSPNINLKELTADNKEAVLPCMKSSCMSIAARPACLDCRNK